MSNQIEEIIDGNEEETLDFTYSITSYGADYPVDGLVKRIENGTIIVPGFQRKYVWSINMASRFIESLLLGLPVPGIFFSKDSRSTKLMVIDGQQRLKTLMSFYKGIFKGKEFKLKGVQERFLDKTYASLDTEDRERLDDSIIHATIVKQDEPSDDESSIYHIFERLNTGGLQLRPQEIRACIYEGPFNELLDELNKNTEWRTIFGKENERKKDQEFILRFFAFLFMRDGYVKPLKEFMNLYMARNRNFELQAKDELTEIFSRTVSFVAQSLGKKAFRPISAMNASIFDSVMVGIANRLEKGAIIDQQEFINKYSDLLSIDDYIKSTTDATSDLPVVDKRIKYAIKQFQDLK